MTDVFRQLSEPCIPQEGKQMVFTLIHCPASKPWADYEGISEEKQQTVIPTAIQIMRWDGYIGNPGGFVEEGESLVAAAVRELTEELGITPYEEELRPLISHRNFARGEFYIHCFEWQVSETKLRRILQDQSDASHYFSEGTAFAVQLFQPTSDRGYGEYLKHNFKATAGLELEFLVQRQGYLEISK